MPAATPRFDSRRKFNIGFYSHSKIKTVLYNYNTRLESFNSNASNVSRQLAEIERTKLLHEYYYQLLDCQDWEINLVDALQKKIHIENKISALAAKPRTFSSILKQSLTKMSPTSLAFYILSGAALFQLLAETLFFSTLPSLFLLSTPVLVGIPFLIFTILMVNAHSTAKQLAEEGTHLNNEYLLCLNKVEDLKQKLQQFEIVEFEKDEDYHPSSRLSLFAFMNAQHPAKRFAKEGTPLNNEAPAQKNAELCQQESQPFGRDEEEKDEDYKPSSSLPLFSLMSSPRGPNSAKGSPITDSPKSHSDSTLYCASSVSP